MDNKCYFCDCKFTPLSTKYKVRVAIKPKGKPNRHKTIGYACEDCGEKNNLTLEQFNDPPAFKGKTL